MPTLWVLPHSLATPQTVQTQGSTFPPPGDLSAALLLIQSQHQKLQVQHQELDARQQKIEAHERRIEELIRKVDALCHKLFGKKSEKVDPNQRELAFELALETKPGETVEMDSGEPLPFDKDKRRRGGIGRRPFPANIPVVEELNDVPAQEKTCTGCEGEKVEIGRESSQKLDYEPASVYNIVTITPKYACPKCHDGVVKAAAPAQAIEKGMAAEGLLSYVITSKYADHLPLHRLESILKRQSVDIDRSTMCGWVGKVAEALAPIYDEVKAQISEDGLPADRRHAGRDPRWPEWKLQRPIVGLPRFSGKAGRLRCHEDSRKGRPAEVSRGIPWLLAGGRLQRV